MTDYAFILTKKYPGKKWSLNGDDYDGLIWVDDSPKPDKATLDAEYMSYKADNDYKEKRVKEYPSPEEQLEMMSEDRLNGTDVWYETIQGIKAKYPKPV